MRHLATASALAASVTAFATAASAHGFGQRYDLPIPLSFYLWGADATVALSFVFLVVFSPPNGRYVLYPRWSCNCRPCSSVRSASSVVRSVFVGFLTVIIAGLFGDQNPMRNLAPVAVGWVGFSFLSAVLGPVWRVLNPWATLYRCSRWMRSRLARRKGERRRVAPTWLGVWPAFVLLIIFAWMELVWSGRDIPADLATALIVYSVMTWAGMS